MKRRNKGFTIIELITAVSIIAILAGLLIPAVSAIRVKAHETAQKAQFAAIDAALLAFKNDYGDYPPSQAWQMGPNPWLSTCGAQKLAEAMVGWDLMGFHPDSAWRGDGYDQTGVGPMTYDPDKVRLRAPGDPETYYERKGPYLDPGKANAFHLATTVQYGEGLYEPAGPLPHDENAYVLCDQFKVKKIRVVTPGPPSVTVEYRAGSPILYYKALTNKNAMVRGATNMSVIQTLRYNYMDNAIICGMPSLRNDDLTHPFNNSAVFYDYDVGILDHKIATRVWPHNPDSYILISAGNDGLFGTSDDIHNW